MCSMYNVLTCDTVPKTIFLFILQISISFCLPPGSYRLSFVIFSDGEGIHAIKRVRLGNQCENYTATDVSQSEICCVTIFLS